MENADDRDKQAVVAEEFTKSTMAVIFFDNIYYSGRDKFDNNEVDESFKESFDFKAKVKASKKKEPRYRPEKTFSSMIYRFSEYFPLNSKTRECAEAIEGSEISLHNFAERENPTLIKNCILLYYILKHFHPVIDRCSYSVLDELIRK